MTPRARAPRPSGAARRRGLAVAVVTLAALWAAPWVDAQVQPAGAGPRATPADAVSTVGGDVWRAARSSAAIARRRVGDVAPRAAPPAESAPDRDAPGARALTDAMPAATVDPATAPGDADSSPSAARAIPVQDRAGDSGSATAPAARPEDGHEGTAAVARHTAPRSFLVISLAVPAELPRDQEVRYAIVGTGASRLYGRLTGALPAGAPRPDSLLVTVGVPARALAGRVVVGHVQFHAGAVSVESPLAIEVDAVPQVQLTAAQSMRAVAAGGRTVVSYTAVNVGNVPDSVDVHLELPSGWRVTGQRAVARAAHSRVVTRHALQVRQAVRGEIELTVPTDAARGPIVLRVHARGARLAASSADVTVEVIDAESSLRSEGPVATIRAAAATGSAPGAAPGVTLTVDGLLADGVQLSARVGSASTRADGASLALAGVGVYRMPPSLSLRAERWTLGVGLAEQRMSDLTGASVAGGGVSAGLVRPRWRGGLLAARPLLGPDRRGGLLLGARALAVTRAGTVGAGVSHLAEHGDAARRLDAVSVSAELLLPAAGAVAAPGAIGELLDRALDGPLGRALRGSVLAGEVGYRGYDRGRGVGWAASAARRGERGAVDLRVTHAPGGSAAFASAAHEVTGTASRLLSSRLSVSGSAWRSADGGGAVDALDGGGAELGMQYRVNAVLGASVDVRRSRWEVASGEIRFGGDERSIVGTLTARRGRAFATAGFLGGPETRQMVLPGGASAATTAARAQLRGALGAGVGTGTLSLDARSDWSAPGGGRPARQSDLTARADRLRLGQVGAVRTYVDATVRRYRVGTDAPALALRGAVRVELPRALAIVAAVERNPFFVTGSGRPGRTFALGVERTTRLPRIGGTPPARGMVFQDLDDDGVRDPGESGFAQVVVRHGDRTGVTSADGSFAMSRARGAEPATGVSIDPLSLPEGFITGRRSERAGRLELAAVAVTPVEVRLTLSAADSARVTPEQLARAVVVTQDSVGRPWVARLVAPGLAVFDALPPGRYRVDVDLSALTEPLRLVEVPPEVVVTGGREPLRITLLLKGRPIRIRQAEPGASPPPAAASTTTATTSAPET